MWVAWLPPLAAMSSEGDGTIVSQSKSTLTLTNTVDALGRLTDVNWPVGQTDRVSVDQCHYTRNLAGTVTGRVNSLISALSETNFYNLLSIQEG